MILMWVKGVLSLKFVGSEVIIKVEVFWLLVVWYWIFVGVIDFSFLFGVFFEILVLIIEWVGFFFSRCFIFLIFL